MRRIPGVTQEKAPSGEIVFLFFCSQKQRKTKQVCHRTATTFPMCHYCFSHHKKIVCVAPYSQGKVLEHFDERDSSVYAIARVLFWTNYLPWLVG